MLTTRGQKDRVSGHRRRTPPWYSEKRDTDRKLRRMFWTKYTARRLALPPHATAEPPHGPPSPMRLRHRFCARSSHPKRATRLTERGFSVRNRLNGTQKLTCGLIATLDVRGKARIHCRQ